MTRPTAFVRVAAGTAGVLGSTLRRVPLVALLATAGACSDSSSIPTAIDSPTKPALARTAKRQALGKIVFAADSTRVDGEPSGFSALFVMNGDGSNVARITAFDTYDAPAWSPDGRSIAFERRVAVQPGSADSVTYVGTMSPNGGRQFLLAPGEAPSWSPDGTRLAFERQFVPSEADVFVMNADGSNVRQLTTGFAFDGEPTWSPDGGRIAFTSSRAGGREVFIMNADGTNPKQLSSCAVLLRTCSEPAWSPVPGDERIAYTERLSANNVLVNTIKSDRSFNITVTDVTLERDAAPSWSADGTVLVFAGRGDALGRRALYSVDAVLNATATRLTSLGADERGPSWKQ